VPHRLHGPPSTRDTGKESDWERKSGSGFESSRPAIARSRPLQRAANMADPSAAAQLSRVRWVCVSAHDARPCAAGGSRRLVSPRPPLQRAKYWRPSGGRVPPRVVERVRLGPARPGPSGVTSTCPNSSLVCAGACYGVGGSSTADSTRASGCQAREGIGIWKRAGTTRQQVAADNAKTKNGG